MLLWLSHDNSVGMGCRPVLEVVVPQELIAAIDDHIERLSAMNKSFSATRSSVAREWMELGREVMLRRLGDDPTSAPIPRLRRWTPPRA